MRNWLMPRNMHGLHFFHGSIFWRVLSAIMVCSLSVESWSVFLGHSFVWLAYLAFFRFLWSDGL